MIVVRPPKFSKLSMTSLPRGSVTWLLRHLLSILSNWIHLRWEGFELFGTFQLLLVVFGPIYESNQPRNFAGQLIKVFRHPSCYLSPFDAMRNLLKSAAISSPENVSRILLDFNPLLSIFTPEKFQASVVNWDSHLTKHRFYVSRNHPLLFSEAKKILSNSAAGMFQLEVCHWGLHFHILLLRCSLFQLFQVYEGWWPDDVANTIEACLEFNSVHLGQFCENNELCVSINGFLITLC